MITVSNTMCWEQVPREIWQYLYDVFAKYGDTSRMFDILIDYENLLKVYGVLKDNRWRIEGNWHQRVYDALISEETVTIFWGCYGSLTNMHFCSDNEDTSEKAARLWSEVYDNKVLVIVRIKPTEFTVETFDVD
jgi:hypothetical protein